MKSQNHNTFITKFDSILRSQQFEGMIKLDESCGKIYIFEKEKFELEILPHFFRHNKLSSFIRQLNLYGFKKIKNTTILCFSHPSLIRGEKLINITSKKKLKMLQQLQLQEAQAPESSKPPNQLLPYNTERLNHTLTNTNNTLSQYLMNTPLIPYNPELMTANQGWGVYPNGMVTYFLPISSMLSNSPFGSYLNNNQE